MTWFENGPRGGRRARSGARASRAARLGWLAALLLPGVMHAAVDVELRQIVESDPRVLAARASWRSRQAEAEGARSAYRPVVRGIGSAGSSRANDPLVRSGAKHTYGVEVEQPIPVFGRESARVAWADTALQVEAAEVQRMEQVVLDEWLESVVTLQAAAATLGLREQLGALFDEQARAAREAVEGGGMKATEERQLLSRKAQAAALRTRAAGEVAAAQAHLARMLPPGQPADFSRPPDLRRWWTGEPSQARFEAAAQAGAPALRKAQAETEQASAEQAVARAEHWPRLSVTLQVVRGSFGAASADAHSAFIGASVPFYEGGATASRVDSAAHKAEAAQERLHHEARLARQRVAEAWVRWQAAEAMARDWQEAETRDAENVALTEEQLARGGATRFSLLQARQAWLETRLQGIDQRAQRDLAWIRLLQEAGALALDKEEDQP